MTRPTPPATSLLELLTTGIAQAVATANIGFGWRDTIGAVPQFVGVRPTGPDAVLAWTPIPVNADPTLSVASIDLQAWYRAGKDIRDVWAMRDRVRHYLSGRFPWVLPTGLHISTLTFGYGGGMGRDDAERWEFADVYRVTCRDSRSTLPA